jgi:hypothetical protein
MTEKNKYKGNSKINGRNGFPPARDENGFFEQF